jgi:hypothetical protein
MQLDARCEVPRTQVREETQGGKGGRRPESAPHRAPLPPASVTIGLTYEAGGRGAYQVREPDAEGLECARFPVPRAHHAPTARARRWAEGTNYEPCDVQITKRVA